MSIRGSNGYFGRAKFKGYLQDLPPDTIVGRRNEYNACPLAVFLAHLIPERDFFSLSVTDTLEYSVHGQYHTHKSPVWATAFIAQIDNDPDADDEVTAAAALALLD